MRNLTLFEGDRLTQERAFNLTAESLNYYGQFHKHWAIAYSGGKDSSATLTAVLHLIESGRVAAPESITVLYADTRQELPPLHFAAMTMLREVERRGCKTQIVCAELDRRFWVYILGRGVPSPNNGTLRWCTEAIKITPMKAALETLLTTLEPGDKLLMLTGVRQGESAARDQRIALSCSKSSGECGQGWYQSMSAPQIATLAPILHWRVCHVWDWLIQAELEHGFPTIAVAEVYGMKTSEGEEPIESRTGCTGCPLVDTDDALDRLVVQPDWAYLKPLQGIKRIHREIRRGENRHRQPGTRLLKSGKHESNPMRMGPLSLTARLKFLDQVLAIQSKVNRAAIELVRPTIDLINSEEEEVRIRELIDLKTFPEGWTGNEPMATKLLPEVYANGNVQNILFEMGA